MASVTGVGSRTCERSEPSCRESPAATFARFGPRSPRSVIRFRSGADRSLPLFLGYAERLRLDADTAVGAAQTIERQIARLEALIDEATAPAKRS